MRTREVFTPAFLRQFRTYEHWVLILHNYGKDGAEVNKEAKALKGTIKKKATILKNAHQTPKKARQGKKATIVAKTKKKALETHKRGHKKAGKEMRQLRKGRLTGRTLYKKKYLQPKVSVSKRKRPHTVRKVQRVSSRKSRRVSEVDGKNLWRSTGTKHGKRVQFASTSRIQPKRTHYKTD